MIAARSSSFARCSIEASPRAPERDRRLPRPARARPRSPRWGGSRPRWRLSRSAEDLRVRHHDHGARPRARPTSAIAGRRRVVAEESTITRSPGITPRATSALAGAGRPPHEARAVRGAPVAADERDARGIAVGRDVQVVVERAWASPPAAARRTPYVPQADVPRQDSGSPGARPCTPRHSLAARRSSDPRMPEPGYGGCHFETSDVSQKLAIDPARTTETIEGALRDDARLRTAAPARHRRRRVRAASTAPMVAALAARALGPDRVLALLMLPERDSSPYESRRLGAARRQHVRHRGRWSRTSRPSSTRPCSCYARQIEAIRAVVPEYGDGWKCKITLPSILERRSRST